MLHFVSPYETAQLLFSNMRVFLQFIITQKQIRCKATHSLRIWSEVTQTVVAGAQVVPVICAPSVGAAN